METLALLAVWGALIFLMMRFGCGAHAMGRRHEPAHNAEDSGAGANELRWVPPESDTDPVCGKTVATAEARPSVHDGQVYYFCSRECREAFEVAPRSYLLKPASRAPRQLEHSHG